MLIPTQVKRLATNHTNIKQFNHKRNSHGSTKTQEQQ